MLNELVARLSDGGAVPPQAVAFVNVYLKRLAKDPMGDDEITSLAQWMQNVGQLLLHPELDLDVPLPVVGATDTDELHPHQHAEMAETIS